MTREKLQDYQRTKTVYEWDFEVTDKYGDVIDHNHMDHLPVKTNLTGEKNNKGDLVLIRDSGTDADGLQDRQWAYTEHDDAGYLQLPSHFDGGYKVPSRYHTELKRWQGD
jgi:hypothetical protein